MFDNMEDSPEIIIEEIPHIIVNVNYMSPTIIPEVPSPSWPNSEEEIDVCWFSPNSREDAEDPILVDSQEAIEIIESSQLSHLGESFNESLTVEVDEPYRDRMLDETPVTSEETSPREFYKNADTGEFSLLSPEIPITISNKTTTPIISHDLQQNVNPPPTNGETPPTPEEVLNALIFQHLLSKNRDLAIRYFLVFKPGDFHGTPPSLEEIMASHLSKDENKRKFNLIKNTIMDPGNCKIS